MQRNNVRGGRNEILCRNVVRHSSNNIVKMYKGYKACRRCEAVSSKAYNNLVIAREIPSRAWRNEKFASCCAASVVENMPHSVMAFKRAKVIYHRAGHARRHGHGASSLLAPLDYLLNSVPAPYQWRNRPEVIGNILSRAWLIRHRHYRIEWPSARAEMVIYGRKLMCSRAKKQRPK